MLVNDVLEQVAQGMAWESIEEQWRGAVSRQAIAEAVHLAKDALLDGIAHDVAEPANT